MIAGLLICCVAVAVMMGTVGFKFLTEINEYSVDSLNNPLVLVCIATGMIFAKVVLQLTFLLIYTYNGSGFILFKFMSTYIFVMA